jgi:hypothetical protein
VNPPEKAIGRSQWPGPPEWPTSHRGCRDAVVRRLRTL